MLFKTHDDIEHLGLIIKRIEQKFQIKDVQDSKYSEDFIKNNNNTEVELNLSLSPNFEYNIKGTKSLKVILKG